MTAPLIHPIDATTLLWSLTVLLADHPDTDRHQLATDIGGLFEGVLGKGPDMTVVADIVEAAPMLLDTLDRRGSHRRARTRIFTDRRQTSRESLHPGSPPADPATKAWREEGSPRPPGHDLLRPLTARVSGVLGRFGGGR